MSRRIGCVVAACSAVLTLVASAPASAGPLNNQLACAAAGNVSVGIPNPDADDEVPWSVNGNGLCAGDKLGPYVAHFTGRGSSTNLGLCDGLTVAYLELVVSLRLVSVASGAVTQLVQTWRAPVTTFPVATPYMVDDASGNLTGAGALNTRIAGNCPPGGISAATFEWGFVKM